MDKEIVKLDYTEIEKYKFHQHKIPFLIDNIDISKKEYLLRSPLVKGILNILLALAILKKLDIHIPSKN